jgi:hypothetical protein
VRELANMSRNDGGVSAGRPSTSKSKMSTLSPWARRGKPPSLSLTRLASVQMSVFFIHGLVMTMIVSTMLTSCHAQDAAPRGSATSDAHTFTTTTHTSQSQQSCDAVERCITDVNCGKCIAAINESVGFPHTPHALYAAEKPTAFASE